ncbi:MAG: MFS transporter [DPANN group archaeon]|nr:MFS transporter [DPANN group archaeon]
MHVLTKRISLANYRNFLWHGIFLALASSFMDVDTIMPAMLGDAGGKAFQIGILVTIMLGGSSFSQLFFAPYLHNRRYKKTMLLVGIHLRILALAGLSALFFLFDRFTPNQKIWLILFLVSLFSFSGAFANISYTDILGKSVLPKQRKSFLSLKQVFAAAGVFLSAIVAHRILATYSLPVNYSLLFLCAAGFLLIATVGFWRIKEIGSKSHYVRDLRGFIVFIRNSLQNDIRLRNYLLLLSTLGISISILPFLVLYGKAHFSLVSSGVGNLLLLKVIGVISMGVFLFFLSRHFTYSKTLYASVGIALAIPLVVFFAGDSYLLFMLAFLLGGLLFAIYTVSMNGVLLEISNTRNRAMYTGLAGVGNIVPALFPLFSGWLIKVQGFTAFFILFGTIVLSSVVFIRRLACRK